MAKTVIPATARGEKTRRKLLEAAEQEFGEQGYYATSISNITRRAGVAQGTFYIYYASKEDILKALFEEMNRRLREFLSVILDDISGCISQEKAGVLHFLDFARRHRNLYRVLLQCQFIDERTFRRHHKALLEAYARRLQAAQEAGEIRSGDARTQAGALMGVSYFLGLAYSLWNDSPPPPEVMETVFSFIERGLSPEPA